MTYPAADPFPSDEVTTVDPNGPRAARHRNLLRAVLLFYSGGGWDEDQARRWRELTGKTEATTRALCDAIRESGIVI